MAGVIPFYCAMFFKDIQEKHQGDKYPVSETSGERKETPINQTQLVPDMPIWSSLFLVADEYILLVTKSTSKF